MKQFQFARGSKTKKGKPQAIRMVTPDHEMYKVYLKGKELQEEAEGSGEDSYVDPKYIKQAEEMMKKV